jgi:hypothetical protein
VGIARHIHPHLFRHQVLTFLTSQGLPDAQVQLISGDGTKRSLEVYRHLFLNTVQKLTRKWSGASRGDTLRCCS